LTTIKKYLGAEKLCIKMNVHVKRFYSQLFQIETSHDVSKEDIYSNESIIGTSSNEGR